MIDFNDKYIKENLMGPNCIKVLEEFSKEIDLKPNMRVLDLGCGSGLTSMYLAKTFDIQVFATDLWISASDNYNRFKELGYENNIIPIHADANDLPFADEYFDAVISVDSYNYFGRNEEYLDKHLLPLVKQGGKILIIMPGMKKDIHNNIPPEMLLSWTPEELDTIHDAKYWTNIIGKSKSSEIISVSESRRFNECWDEWLECDNEYAVKDRKAMSAGAGEYMNLLAFVLCKK